MKVELFKSAEYDEVPINNGFVRRAIILNTETQQYKIIEWENHLSGYSTFSKCKTIIFDDPSILENAIKELKKNDGVKLNAMGAVNIDEEYRDTSYSEPIEQESNTTEVGIVSCNLETRDGFLLPFFYILKVFHHDLAHPKSCQTRLFKMSTSQRRLTFHKQLPVNI